MPSVYFTHQSRRDLHNLLVENIAVVTSVSQHGMIWKHEDELTTMVSNN